MKILCIDPLIRGRSSSFTIFDENFTFVSHQIVQDHSSLQQYFDSNEYQIICFDAMKVMEAFFLKLPFVYDVKVLYELNGKRFSSIIELGIEVFGHEKLEKYIDLSNKVKAHLRSYTVLEINAGKYELQRLFPEGLLENLYIERAHLIVQLYRSFSEHEKLFYKDFYKTIECLHSISRVPLNVDISALDNSHFSDTIRTHTKDGKLFLKFEPVGAKTGRLSFRKKTPNLYVLPKDLRRAIVARPGYSIVQMDFKSFQPRLAICATEDESFKDKFRHIDDIYSVFDGDREENKLLFISWMYSNMYNEKFEQQAHPIKELRKKLYTIANANNDSELVNPFGRVLFCHNEKDNVVFQNYITSLEVDTILSIMCHLNEKLKTTRSRIMFPFHDAIVFEIFDGEDFLIQEISDEIRNWCIQKYGMNFPVEVKSSFSFGVI